MLIGSKSNFHLLAFLLPLMGSFSAQALQVSEPLKLVQQDIILKVTPLSCALQVVDTDSLTCYIEKSSLKLPMGGAIVSDRTLQSHDKVRVSASPRDNQFIQVVIYRGVGDETVDLKSVWQSGLTTARLVYQGPPMGTEKAPRPKLKAARRAGL